jgi:ketosteroid isomerase-like protein
VEDTIGVVQEFYSALGAGDVTRAVAVLSPDLEWTEAEAFPTTAVLGAARRP